MVELLKNYLRTVDVEEDSVRKTLAADRVGLILRAALNEMDSYYYRLKSQDSEATEEQEWQFCILMLGATRLIRLVLESREKFDAPTLTFPRTEQTANAALAPIAHLGRLRGHAVQKRRRLECLLVLSRRPSHRGAGPQARQQNSGPSRNSSNEPDGLKWNLAD